MTRLGGELMSRSRERRFASSIELMDAYFPDVVDPRERLKRLAVVRGMISSRYWRILTLEMGLSSAEAIEIATWAVEQVQAGMDNR